MNTELLEKLREALAAITGDPIHDDPQRYLQAKSALMSVLGPIDMFDTVAAAVAGHRSRDGEVAEKDDLLVGAYLHALDAAVNCHSCDGSGQDDDGEHFLDAPCKYCQGPRALMGSIWTNLPASTQASVRALLDLENGDARIAFYELWGNQAIRDERTGQKVEFYKPPAMVHKEEIARLTQEKIDEREKQMALLALVADLVPSERSHLYPQSEPYKRIKAYVDAVHAEIGELRQRLEDRAEAHREFREQLTQEKADLLAVVRGIVMDLPTNRDWLDPLLEAEANALLAKHSAKGDQ